MQIKTHYYISNTEAGSSKQHKTLDKNLGAMGRLPRPCLTSGYIFMCAEEVIPRGMIVLLARMRLKTLYSLYFPTGHDHYAFMTFSWEVEVALGQFSDL